MVSLFLTYFLITSSYFDFVPTLPWFSIIVVVGWFLLSPHLFILPDLYPLFAVHIDLHHCISWLLRVILLLILESNFENRMSCFDFWSWYLYLVLWTSGQLNKPMANGWYVVSLVTLRSKPRPRLVRRSWRRRDVIDSVNWLSLFDSGFHHFVSNYRNCSELLYDI